MKNKALQQDEWFPDAQALITLGNQHKGNYLNAESQLPVEVPAQTAEFRCKVKCKNDIWVMMPKQLQKQRQTSQSSGLVQLFASILCVDSDMTFLVFLSGLSLLQMFLQAGDLAKAKENF